MGKAALASPAAVEPLKIQVHHEQNHALPVMLRMIARYGEKAINYDYYKMIILGLQVRCPLFCAFTL
jgi:hypothetical protein